VADLIRYLVHEGALDVFRSRGRVLGICELPADYQFERGETITLDNGTAAIVINVDTRRYPPVIGAVPG
jgi:hypothetical protein